MYICIHVEFNTNSQEQFCKLILPQNTCFDNYKFSQKNTEASHQLQ